MCGMGLRGGEDIKSLLNPAIYKIVLLLVLLPTYWRHSFLSRIEHKPKLLSWLHLSQRLPLHKSTKINQRKSLNTNRKNQCALLLASYKIETHLIWKQNISFDHQEKEVDHLCLHLFFPTGKPCSTFSQIIRWLKNYHLWGLAPIENYS